MKNNEIRKMYDEYGKENDLEIKFFENPSFDYSIIGISSDGRLIYDYKRMVCELSEEDNISPLEAQDFIDYNTMRALPYFGEHAPIVLYVENEDLKMMY